MELKKGNKLYIRLDTKLADRGITPQEMKGHLDYIKAVAMERQLAGGSFTNQDGGICLFQGASLEEARDLCQRDPIILSGLYRCDVYEWNLFIVSEHIEK